MATHPFQPHCPPPPRRAALDAVSSPSHHLAIDEHTTIAQDPAQPGHVDHVLHSCSATRPEPPNWLPVAPLPHSARNEPDEQQPRPTGHADCTSRSTDFDPPQPPSSRHDRTPAWSARGDAG